jgi:hypothetical protein
MDTLYRFSPITSELKLYEAIAYIAHQTTQMCYQLVHHHYPISSLTVFSHYQDEYEILKRILLSLGKIETENNGPFVKLRQPIDLPNNKLQILRVRQPDPYRMQVGCNDFEVPNYSDFKKNFLNKTDNIRFIERPEYEMIEFFHPDYDVLAYVLNEQLI